MVRSPEAERSPPPRARPLVIEARKLTKHYGHVRALEDVDFSLAEGEVHALVGDNGAGKSTLVKIIAGATAATSGELYLDGQIVDFHSPDGPLAAGISTVYQNLALVGCRSIADNLFLGRELTRLGFLRKRRMVREAREMLGELRQVNITNPRAKVEDLSGGQRQAVAIARSIRLGTRILILDEPTAALGVRESQGVLELIDSLRSDERSILVISHNLSHVFAVADRITVLRGGRRVGTVDKAVTSPDEIVGMITAASGKAYA